MTHINNNFKAVYNPFTRDLAVEYGSKITEYTFESGEEWVKISFNGDQEHPNYLHVQLDYDECLQLLFYPRVDGSELLNEESSVCFFSENMVNIHQAIKIVYNDSDYKQEVKKLVGEIIRDNIN